MRNNFDDYYDNSFGFGNSSIFVGEEDIMCWKCRIIKEYFLRNKWNILWNEIESGNERYNILHVYCAIFDKVWSITIGRVWNNEWFKYKYHK